MTNKRYFCDQLNNVFTCMNEKIMSCCTGHKNPVYFDIYNGEKIDWESLKKIKEEAFEMLTEENIKNSPCNGCFYLRERTSEDKVNSTFNHIIISHWTQCNCGCIYCARMYHSNGEITSKTRKSDYYDFLPILKDLYKNNLIDKENITASIQGGDISVLKEFEPIVKEFLKRGIKYFMIMSNNIKYQPIIKKLLDKDMCYYTTSLDCGSKELYYKLKRVDKFKDVINNLKKYLKSKHPEKIYVKYIVIEHFNDNLEEITKFMNLMSEIGIKNVEFMIDNKYVLFTDLDKEQIPSHYGELYLHFKKLCEEKNIEFNIWDKTEDIINRYALNK